MIKRKLVGFKMVDRESTDIYKNLSTSQRNVLYHVNKMYTGNKNLETIVIAVKVVCHYFPHEYCNLTRNYKGVASRVISVLSD